MSTKTFKKRSRMAIFSEILSLCNEKPEIKTHIMYKVNLSYQIFHIYLGLLLDKELLVPIKNEHGIRYKTTKKGRNFIRIFNEINNILSI